MANVNIKNITELPLAESAEGLNLIVNDNGSAKQIAASAIGASGNNSSDNQILGIRRLSEFAEIEEEQTGATSFNYYLLIYLDRLPDGACFYVINDLRSYFNSVKYFYGDTQYTLDSSEHENAFPGFFWMFNYLYFSTHYNNYSTKNQKVYIHSLI